MVEEIDKLRCSEGVNSNLMAANDADLVGSSRARRSSRKCINYALVAKGRDDSPDVSIEDENYQRQPIKIKLKINKTANKGQTHCIVNPIDEAENLNLRDLLMIKPPKAMSPSDFELPKEFCAEVADAENKILQKEIVDEIEKLENKSLIWMNYALKLAKCGFISSFDRYYKELDPNRIMNDDDKSMKLTVLAVEMAAKNYRMSRSTNTNAFSVSKHKSKMIVNKTDDSECSRSLLEVKKKSDDETIVEDYVIPPERRLIGQPPSKMLIRNVSQRMVKRKGSSIGRFNRTKRIRFQNGNKKRLKDESDSMDIEENRSVDESDTDGV